MKKAVGLLTALLVLLSSVSAHAAETAKLWGDANGDGAVTVLDVTTIQKHLVELEKIGDETSAIVFWQRGAFYRGRDLDSILHRRSD